MRVSQVYTTTFLLEEFHKKNIIYFENISYGLKNYKNEIVTLAEKEAYNFFLEKKRQYGTENAFADFYFFALEKEAKEKVMQVLTQEELTYLDKIQPTEINSQLIFCLEDELLQIIVKLNALEMLFSTIYFQSTDILKAETYWGNYCREYIKFCLE